MATGPSDLLFPSYTEGGIQKWANTDIRRGPDFSDITKAFSTLMSNPTLLARGGAWNDPQQVQQQATPGYLNARSGVAQNRMQNIGNDAALAKSAGNAQGNILDLMNQINTMQTGTQGSMFGSLLGGMF